MVWAINRNIKLDGHTRQYIADIIHVAGVVLFEAVCFDEGIEADDVGLAPPDRISDKLFKRSDHATVPAVEHRELD